MNEASIFIIIPAYNVGSLLDRCMQSVLAQTLTHIEILLINDGSTNNITAERCDYWGDKDDRVSVFHQQNQGLAQTCNIGVKRTKGTFIGFVDSDD